MRVIKTLHLDQIGYLQVLDKRKKMKRIHRKTNRSMREVPRVPRKKGQHRGSSSHSDLYTDENPKGTINGLKFYH